MTLVVEWQASDPSALGTALAEALRLPRPDPGADRLAFLLESGSLVVARSPAGEPDRITAAELLADAPGPARGPDGASTARPAAVRLLGMGWATVDLDRGCSETAERFGLVVTDFRSAPDEGWLGARSRVARIGRVSIVVLEPATEGRLAAALARAGEGPVAVYVGVAGPAREAVRAGALGPSTLVHAARPWGPFVLGVPRPPSATVARGTIGR